MTLMDRGLFLLLDQIYALPPMGGWDDEGMDKLRRYNLHYFDDLSAMPPSPGAAWHSAWIERWIAENKPREGSGWEPYPTSLRIVNWIKWLLASNHPPPKMLWSLALQARWLARRLEWHLLGNHLFVNAKALVFAGVFFEGAEADDWLRIGTSIIEAQLAEQVLADGGHFERSPMYHAQFVEDLLDLINAANLWPNSISQQLSDSLQTAVGKMLHCLSIMTHPDGEIALFNDSAFGIAAKLSDLDAYARRLGVMRQSTEADRLTLLPDTGYARVIAGPAVAFVDLAPIGPDYLPGHAHADTLSFELSLGNQRLIVNGGTSEYGSGPVRQFERSTAAHNTVEIDGQDSSEVWGGFRVARRAQPIDLAVEIGPEIEIACSHDGYVRLPGRPIHRRKWRFDDAGMTIEDIVEGTFDHAVARFLVVPDVVMSSVDARLYRLETGSKPIAEIRIPVGRASCVSGYYAPRFSTRTVTQCLSVELEQGRSRVEFSWL